MYKNLKAEIARADMTITSFCAKLGIERRTYYNWQEEGNIPAQKLIAIADLFGVTTDYILGLSDKRTA